MFRLPQARSVRARVCKRIEGALDHGQQRQLGRHRAALEFLDDVVEIQPAAREHPVKVLRLGHVLGDLAPYQRVIQIWHSEAAADPLPEPPPRGVTLFVSLPLFMDSCPKGSNFCGL